MVFLEAFKLTHHHPASVTPPDHLFHKTVIYLFNSAEYDEIIMYACLNDNNMSDSWRRLSHFDNASSLT